MFTEHKINRIRVKPVVSQVRDPKKILASKMFSIPFCNVGILSKKKSGKSTLIYNALEKVCHRTTKVYLFCGSLHRDETYRRIQDMLEKKGCSVYAKTHFLENGVNLLDEIIHMLKHPE